MKKLFIPVTALLLMAGSTKAADAAKSTVENKAVSASTAAYSYEMLMAENLKLRQQTEMLNVQVEDLNNKLGYTHMMHATLTNLDRQAAAKATEDLNNQLDYARMMQVTLTNLAVLTAATK